MLRFFAPEATTSTSGFCCSTMPAVRAVPSFTSTRLAAESARFDLEHHAAAGLQAPDGNVADLGGGDRVERCQHGDDVVAAGRDRRELGLVFEAVVGQHNA